MVLLNQLIQDLKALLFQHQKNWLSLLTRKSKYYKISNSKINGIQIDNFIKNNKKYPVLFKNEYVYYYDENANLKGKIKFNLMDTNSNGFKYSISNTNNLYMFTDKIDYIVVKNDGVYLFNKDNKFITFLI